MTTQNDLVKTIEEAKARVRRMAEVSPYIFPEYSALRAAQEDYELARKRLDAAQAVWDRISK